jgi:integrase
MKRQKTAYPGVFFREVRRVGGKGTEKVFYVVYKKSGKVIEEKAGHQFRDNMTPARASSYRSQRIEGKVQSKKEIRVARKVKKAETTWTVDKLWEEYTAQTTLKGLAKDRSRYKNYLEPAFGDKEPKDILPLDVDRVRLRNLKGKSPQTIKLVLQLLLRLSNFAAKKKLCPPLAFRIEVPKVNNLKTEDLSQDQIKKLVEVIDADTHTQAGPMMKLALFTGMRRGELFKLKWRDIDFERGFITIRDPKGTKDQKIPLNDGAREILTNHFQTESEYVFGGHYGLPRTRVEFAIREIKRKAGLPDDFRPLHGLRHTYASMLASSGSVDLYTLQKLMTHQTPQMTQRYAHLRDETLKKASSIASDLVSIAISGKKEQSKADG